MALPPDDKESDKALTEQASDEKRALQNKVFNLALNDLLDDVGHIQIAVKPSDNASSGQDDKKKRDKDRKFSTTEMLMMLNTQAQYWGEQAEMYEAQVGAVDKAIQNVLEGKDPTDGMTPEEKQHFEDAVQEYKDKYGLEDIDLKDPAVLLKIKALAEENQANAQKNEAEAQAHHENITNAPNEEAKQAAIQNAANAGSPAINKIATELGDDLNASLRMLKQRGYNSEDTRETTAAYGDANSFFSSGNTLDDLDGLDTPPTTAQTVSYASTLDEKTP
ncbi:MAG: hypothetical protein MI743_07450, partial [Sneathiellales bacterium]|nr:hypothetical protein [Sneathiellales bacterium]